MMFEPAALQAALAQHLSAEYAPALTAHLVAQGLSLTDGLPSAAIGDLLLRVLSSYSGGEDPSLAAVTFVVRGAPMVFDPEDAEQHPLLRGWLPPTLSAAVAAPLLAGAFLQPITVGAPDYGAVEIVEGGGLLLGRILLRFQQTQIGEVQVCCSYGPPAVPTAFSTTRRLDGSALLAMGAQLRLGLSEQNAATGDASREVPASAWTSASAMIH
ncbi:hypothetical protein ACO2Q3_22630 [Caulobacter sp. KR2-114]|uniref:hypothetical protein n=1 Tax=Caulobacter sp. KR2-114 TaxID=3400912 RepID=UPI003C0FC67E